MLFFALLFIFTSVYGLIKGRLFYSVFLEAAKEQIKQARGEINTVPKEVNGKVFVVTLYLMFYTIAQFTFIIKSLKIDPYLYPTLGIIVFIFLNFVINLSRQSKDLTNEEGRAKHLVAHIKRYTFQGTLTKLVYITYFGYMFAVLLDLIK
jgi:hypothetical protein